MGREESLAVNGSGRGTVPYSAAIAEEAAREAAGARRAQARLLLARPRQMVRYFRAVEARLREAAGPMLAANRFDLAEAEGGYSPAILDRGRLTPERLVAMAAEQVAMADAPEVVGRAARSWMGTSGLRFREMRQPLGLIAAVFEARYNVLLDIAGQAFKARNVVLLKGGRMLARTDAALVDYVVRPALAEAGLPESAAGFMRTPDRACAVAMLDQHPDACIGRGGNELIRVLAEACGERRIELIAHDKGGAWLYVDRRADPQKALAMIENSLDRRGVCNRLNVLLVHADLAAEFLPAAARLLNSIGIAVHATRRAAPHLPAAASLRNGGLSHEWLSDDLSVDTPRNWQEAVRLANRYDTGIGLSVCTADDAAAGKMALLYDGAFFGHNAITRFHDGFQIYARPETGIVTRTTTGARGAVTYVDLTQRKILATGTGFEKR